MRTSSFPKLAACAALVLTTASCGNGGKTIDPKLQIGSNPVLPDPQAYLVPPMQVPSAIGWKAGETPKVADGLQITALASDLLHPRGLYVLPNGDVLIIEANGPGGSPTYRPKDLIAGRVKAAGGTTGKGGNRITLVRYAADGKVALRTVFLSNLHSPYSVALVGSDLYVSNTDNIMRFPYEPGRRRSPRPA